MAWYHHHPVHLTSTLSCPGHSCKPTLVPSPFDKYLILPRPLLQAHSGRTHFHWTYGMRLVFLYRSKFRRSGRLPSRCLTHLQTQQLAVVCKHDDFNKLLSLQPLYVGLKNVNSSSSECYSCDLHCKM